MELAMGDVDAHSEEKLVECTDMHGTSTLVGDLSELGVIKRLFDRKGYQPSVGSTKSLLGHTLGRHHSHDEQ